MAFDSLDKLLAALPVAQRLRLNKIAATAEGAGTFHSLMKVAGNPGAAASNPASGTGRIPTAASAGALRLANPGGSNVLRLARFEAGMQVAGSLILYDRLWDNSGLVGNINTAQAVNSLALDRPDANGEDVELWGEVFTAMGATGSTFTATYTNQDGVGGKSATYVQPANALSVGQMFPFSLAAGDSGVRSVQSVQLSVSTGTAGDFGLVLLRRVAAIHIPTALYGETLDFSRTGLPRIYSNAALFFMVFCSSTSTGQIASQADIVEVES